MPKSRPPYAPQFRAEAVQLWRSSGKTLKDVAGDLGISTESLRHWVKQADIDEGKRPGLTTDERLELRKLRREVKILQEERDILKKAAAFFVREADPRGRE